MRATFICIYLKKKFIHFTVCLVVNFLLYVNVPKYNFMAFNDLKKTVFIFQQICIKKNSEKKI